MSVEKIRCYGPSFPYRLSDFTPEELALAKVFLKKALLGFFTVKSEEIIEDWVEKLKSDWFGGNDTFHFHYSIETKGNDFLVAIGAARNELEDQHGDAKGNHDVENIQTESLAEFSPGANFPGRYNP